jgi:hypothetical protein
MDHELIDQDLGGRPGAVVGAHGTSGNVRGAL